jgi:hypothetical protein
MAFWCARRHCERSAPSTIARRIVAAFFVAASTRIHRAAKRQFPIDDEFLVEALPAIPQRRISVELLSRLQASVKISIARHTFGAVS